MVYGKNNILTTAQTGFRKYKSTIDQIVHLENAIQNSYAKRNHLVAVFFDLEKAYDTTWRYHILKTLHNFGLRGNLGIPKLTLCTFVD